MNTQRCADHSTIADDWRAYADSALDILEPLVERIRTQPPPQDADAEPTSCADCPVCAVITVLRGGRSELAVRLADQLGELLEALRTALAEGAGAPPKPGRPAPKASGGPRGFRSPRVQHISVVRDGGPC